jgi:hypothetical protein
MRFVDEALVGRPWVDTKTPLIATREEGGFIERRNRYNLLF